MEKRIKIMIATHKKYQFPNETIYLPIHVGREGKQDLGYIGDNTGENISKKNQYYCELTGVYWAWKNLKCDYIGLVHYRRYFLKENGINQNDILTEQDLNILLDKYDIILPEKIKTFRRNVRKEYESCHFKKDLDNLEEVIKVKYPEYVSDFHDVMDSNKLSCYNMVIMSKDNFDDYSKWLFDILFALEKITNMADYSPYQKRLYGFLSERLLNVWVNHQKKLRICYLPVYETEPLKGIKKYQSVLKMVMGIRN